MPSSNALLRPGTLVRRAFGARGLVLAAAVALFAPATVGCSSRHCHPAAAAHRLGESIVVVGVGKAQAKPDIARINLGIEARALTVAEASKDNAEQMNRLIAALKGAGIAEKDIQTSNYSVNFERNHDGGPVPFGVPVAPTEAPAPAPSGKRPATTAAPAAATASAPAAAPARPAVPAGFYRVSNTVTIVVRDLTKVGSTLDAAVATGANNVWGVNFELESLDAVESQLRTKAVADAKARATELASLNHVELGEIIQVSEVVGRQGVVPQGALAKAGGYGYAMDSASPIESGELSFQAQVEVTYAIKKR